MAAEAAGRALPAAPRGPRFSSEVPWQKGPYVPNPLWEAPHVEPAKPRLLIEGMFDVEEFFTCQWGFRGQAFGCGSVGWLLRVCFPRNTQSHTPSRGRLAQVLNPSCSPDVRDPQPESPPHSHGKNRKAACPQISYPVQAGASARIPAHARRNSNRSPLRVFGSAPPSPPVTPLSKEALHPQETGLQAHFGRPSQSSSKP